MVKLFKRCQAANYTHTKESGDYAIEYENGTIYLLFEWSDGKEDWKNNFNFPAKPYKRMTDKWHCHRGFLKVWKAMRDDIEAQIADLFSLFTPIKKIVCVGYSHGAAISLLATEDMTYLYGSKVKVEGYGFGCPRVLWGKIPKAVKERLKTFKAVRVVPDLVTHVPPALFGFKHINLTKIGKKGKYGPIRAHYPDVYTTELLNINKE